MASTMLKTVKKYGNSGGVYVPSSWIGGRVKIELISEPPDPTAALSKIPLEHVIGVFIYGSYVRNEMSEGSDIDMLVVTDGDAAMDMPEELRHNYDIQTRTVQQAKYAMSHDPLFYKAMMDESVALINHRLLEDLKKETLKQGSLKTRLDLAESSLNIIREIAGAGDYSDIIYPLIMRLKEILIMECLLDNKKYSTAALQKDILKCGVKAMEFLTIMNIYRSARNNKTPENEYVQEQTVEKLIALMEAKVHYVEKESEKRHRIP